MPVVFQKFWPSRLRMNSCTRKGHFFVFPQLCYVHRLTSISKMAKFDEKSHFRGPRGPLWPCPRKRNIYSDSGECLLSDCEKNFCPRATWKNGGFQAPAPYCAAAKIENVHFRECPTPTNKKPTDFFVPKKSTPNPLSRALFRVWIVDYLISFFLTIFQTSKVFLK